MGKNREGSADQSRNTSGENKEERAEHTPKIESGIQQEPVVVVTRNPPLTTEELSPDIRVRHHNRNADKGEFLPRRGEDQGFKSPDLAGIEADNKIVAEELVPIIPKDLFNFLASYKSDICISILLPTHKAGMEVNEQLDLREYKNSLQRVEKILAQKDFDPSRINKFMEPAYNLLRDFELWHHLSNGLAIYMAADFFKFIRLPGTVPNELYVNSTFCVSPLIPFMVRKEYFYILVLSKKEPKFYWADYFGIEYIPIDELPKEVNDVVHIENKHEEKLFRLGSRGQKVAAYHGMGAGKPDDKIFTAEYFEAVDDTLWKTHLHYSTAPLLLAGIDFEIPIYRSVTDYNYVWPEAITINMENVDSNTLYKKAMAVMQPYFEQNLLKALEEYGNKSATPLTSHDIKEIIPWTFYGRVSHLFIRKDLHIWGTFNEEANKLKLTEAKTEHIENLADRAAAKTIQFGGDVFILEKEKMPHQAELSAVFRF